MTKCPECSDTGERDSGGIHPWGESILLPCDCKDAEIGRQWRENSSLEKWFPITAKRLVALEAENAALKRDLEYARSGLTKGRTRMREDNERLRDALQWIDGATAATPGLTDAELGRAMAAIGKKARDALGA